MSERIILKIIVDGPFFGSGKTTFIRTISEIEIFPIHTRVSSNPDADYMAMDFGLLRASPNIYLYLLGTPASRRFLFNWEIAQQNLIGYIVMVDSAFPETWREARSLCETMRAYYPVPYVVVANKQDLPNAASPEYVRERLHIDDEIPVLPCIATDRESVKAVLVALLDEVIKAVEAKELEELEADIEEVNEGNNTHDIQ